MGLNVSGICCAGKPTNGPAAGPGLWPDLDLKQRTILGVADEAALEISNSSALNYQLHDPDVRLMLEVRDDKAAAFEELMLRYQNRLVTVLEHLVGRRDLGGRPCPRRVFASLPGTKAVCSWREVFHLAVHHRQ